MKNNILIIVILIVIAFAFYFLFQNNKDGKTENETIESEETSADNNEQGNDQGLKIEVLKEGSGAAAKNGDKVTVHYTGWLENGTKFDSSLDRGKPFSFLLGTGQVIKGWDIGVLGAKVGEKRKLTIPPELAYGQRGTPGGPIPPNATLIFEVELLALNE